LFHEILICVFLVVLAVISSTCVAGESRAGRGRSAELFRDAEKAGWKTVFTDPCTKDWKKHWTLDGEKARITNGAKGMDFHAGPEFRNDAHHAVLWTRESFSGDLRVDYEYTRLDDARKGVVTILYMFATGSGRGPYKKDISAWAGRRKVPAMKTYYNNMNALHISYSAFNFGVDVNEKTPDYVRARRYMPLKGKGLRGTDLKPDYSRTGLFKRGVPHRITVIKRGRDVFMRVENKSREKFFHWKNTLAPLSEGRIGLRHMYTRAARYRDFRVSVPAGRKGAGGDASGSAKLDEFDKLRLKWRRILTGGGGYDPEDPRVAATIGKLDEEAAGYWKSMNKKAGRKHIWPEYEELKKRAWNYRRLKTMTLAWCARGSKLEGNKQLLADISAALDWLYEHRYNERMPLERPGWFHPEIFIPQTLNDIVVLLYDELSEKQKKNYMTAIERFCPDTKLKWGRKATEMTGANRAYKARVICIRGIIVKDSKKIALARDALSNIFPYVTSDDGFYRDGSFIQHHRHPYTGGYATGLLRDVGLLLELLEGSRWKVTDPERKNVYEWVRSAYQPIMYKGNAMDMVRGRTIASYSGSQFGAGGGIALAAARLAQSAPPEDALAIKRMIKYWVKENTFRPVCDHCDTQGLLLLKSIVDDPEVTSRGDLELCKVFANMDRVVHHRPGFTFAISMHSDRIYNYESIYGHNKCGWYTGYGMTYLYNADLAQYSEEFWPTVDMQRLAGTTVARGSKPKHRLLNRNKWVGGVEWERTYGAAGMWLAPKGQTLQARKSWFTFDDEIVALGSGISCKDGRVVETIVENRKLGTGGKNALTVNGAKKPAELGWPETLKAVTWAHLAGSVPGADVGWYFPEPVKLRGLREARTGMWKDISDLGNRQRKEDGKYTRNYLTLWFDHGKDPEAASYACVLLPNRKAAEVGKYAEKPDVEIVAHTTRVHAVREKKLGLLAANFWTPGPNKADVLTCKGQASVMLGEAKEGELVLAVADPTHAGARIELEIARKASKVLSKDREIKVERLSPTIRLSVSVKGRHGRSLSVRMRAE
jgi:hyaluronate lyase